MVNLRYDSFFSIKLLLYCIVLVYVFVFLCLAVTYVYEIPQY